MSILNNIHEEVEQAVTIEQLCKDLYRRELDDWDDGTTTVTTMMESVNKKLQPHGVYTFVNYYERTGPGQFKLYIKLTHNDIRNWLASPFQSFILEYSRRFA